MNTAIQEQMPAWYFAFYGKPLQKRFVDTAYNWVYKARRLTRRDIEREFQGRGFRVNYQSLSFAGVRMRARLNLRGKELFIDPDAEADLFGELDRYGLPTIPSPKELILAHELFHLLCPRCPSEVAELAAHLYCAETFGLDYFPGLLDLNSLNRSRLESQAS